jgi:hypothetical protein
MPTEMEIQHRLKDLEIRLYRLAQECQAKEDAFMRQVADNDAEQTTLRKEADDLAKELTAAVAARLSAPALPPRLRNCAD